MGREHCRRGPLLRQIAPSMAKKGNAMSLMPPDQFQEATKEELNKLSETHPRVATLVKIILAAVIILMMVLAIILTVQGHSLNQITPAPSPIGGVNPLPSSTFTPGAG